MATVSVPNLLGTVLYNGTLLCLSPNLPILPADQGPRTWQFVFGLTQHAIGLNPETLAHLARAIGALNLPIAVTIESADLAGLTFYSLSIVAPQAIELSLNTTYRDKKIEVLTGKPLVESLWDQLYGEIKRAGTRTVREPQDREDEIHEVAAVVLANLRKFRGTSIGELKKWISTICHNHWANTRRAHTNEEARLVHDDTDSGDGKLNVKRMEREVLLQELLGGLAPEDRRIVELRADGYTFEEIHRELGISRQTASDQWQRIMKLLRNEGHV